MTEFTPLQSLGGGVLIGLASTLLMAILGRVAGVTGILSGLLPPLLESDWPWRVAFIAGMIAAPLTYGAITTAPMAFTTNLSIPALLAGGVIVGAGATYGSGCTSGHGVCGLARLSVRSVAAVITFMTAATLTIYVARHVLGI